MSRNSDVTIFGATGFTGQRVAAEAVRSMPQHLRITLAGRSVAKLQALAEQLKSDRVQVLGGVDVSNTESLAAMAQQTKLLLNCVGPFRHHGEAVFAAAAAAGTDYLDICGEPEFIERMELRYAAAASSSGALMASAAGMDSIPADLGAVFVSQEISNRGWLPAAVEAVITINAPRGSKIHYATWEAAVHGFGSVNSLRALRREARAAGLNKPPKLIGSRPKHADGPTWDKRVNGYTLPFPGADAAVVRRTQSALSAAGEPAVHFSVRFKAGGFYSTLLFVLYGGVMTVLCKYAWGRALMLRCPGLFSRGLVSHEGPTQEQMDTTTTKFDLYATAYGDPVAAAAAAGGGAAAAAKPDKQLYAQVAFGDPGYIYTSVMLVQSAITMLEERNKLLESVGGQGGVFTVASLFRKSSLVKRLSDHGVKFTVVSSSTWN